MNRQILKQMIEIAGSKRAGDLSYDIMALTSYEGQFVWCIYGDSYTGLQKCSKAIILKALNTEQSMYYYASHGYSLCIPFFSDAKFYWCGAEGSNQLIEITKEQAIGWCQKQYEEALMEWRAQGHEFPKKLIVDELKINCPVSYLEEQLEYAKKHNDNSLDNILKSLSNRQRCARNHYIQIDKDFAERSFIFTEFINGAATLRGGIIFHGYPGEGYKENYSVQLNRTYGWQMHT